MRKSSVLSAMLVTLLLGVGLAFRSEVSAQLGNEQSPLLGDAGSGNGLIAVELDGNEVFDALALIDPVARKMSVYHVDRSNGEITLRSVRNVTWDLQLDEFNGTNPTPRDIRSQVQPR